MLPAHYLLRRVFLMCPTLLGIVLLNFFLVQIAPGGPVEQMVASLTGHASEGGGHGAAVSETTTVGATTAAGVANSTAAQQAGSYKGTQGLDPALIARIQAAYGFDQPWYTRLGRMALGYMHGDLGTSFVHDVPVWQLIMSKVPVSLSLGLWSTLLVYVIAIPLGIRKAVREGTCFDVSTSILLVFAYAIPSFLFGLLLLILFAGGSYWTWFPLRGLVSDNSSSLPWSQQILDYAWHLVLPITALVIGGFAQVTFLTKNAFLGEIAKQYVRTARAKGASAQRVLYGHVFRNAMLVVVGGFPETLLKMVFMGALLIEIVFSLDGMGLLAYESALHRDYPVIFGSVFLFSLLGLLASLCSDMVYAWLDPRIHFDTHA
jgi:microcin C transport system permease protein